MIYLLRRRSWQLDITGTIEAAGENGDKVMDTTINNSPTPATSPEPTPQAEFHSIVTRANNGDRDALARLRQTLDNNPTVWADVSRVAIESERVLVDQVAGGDRLIEESVRRTLKQMRASLSGPSPTPAEKMAVDRVVVAWLLLQVAEKAFIADRGNALPQAQFILKKHDLAHRQYGAAVKSLLDLQERLPKDRPESSNANTGLRLFDGGETQQSDQVRATGTFSLKS